ncbi:MAG: exodeoxyribonuclease VII small subunit [Caldiserica bacterium]|nr:exodeoxyribonuclease VII small subunit [Caldisericota bacterium]
MRLEDALKRLEDLVRKLEEGNLPLEESLKIFEEGVKLVRLCTEKINEVEKKIEILKETDEGELLKLPYSVEEENGKES